MHRADPLPRILLFNLLLALGLTLADPAHAAAPSRSCDDAPECQRLAAEGVEHFSAGRFTEAQLSYERAYALRPDPVLLYNLGRAMHKAGQLEQAGQYYKRFLDAGAAGDAAQQRKAEQYLAEVRKETAPPPSLPAPSPTQPLVPLLGTPPDAPPARVPLYRKPWLWAAVGISVAAAAVGLGVGLASRRPDLSGTLPDYPFAN